MALVLAALVSGSGPVPAVAAPEAGSAKAAPEAFSPPKACFGRGGSRFYNVTLPAQNRRFTFRVVPDRPGFNVIMALDYPPNIFFVANRFGPGRAEAAFVNPQGVRRAGRVTITGVGGSFGCFRLTVTP